MEIPKSGSVVDDNATVNMSIKIKELKLIQWLIVTHKDFWKTDKSKQGLVCRNPLANDILVSITVGLEKVKKGDNSGVAVAERIK